MNHEDTEAELSELLATALELRDEGRAVDVDALCAGRPELASSLREALGLAADLDQLHASASTRDHRLGTLLVGRYRLDERIGAGSMGIVYRGVDRDLGRPVAVKVLHADCLAAAEAQARFLREAEVLAAVSHPAVVTVFDRGSTAAGEHFVVMELLDGENASQLVERAAAACGSATAAPRLDDPAFVRSKLGDLPLQAGTWLRTTVQWIAELALGLAAVHAAGIRHRDIKPSNVFLRRSGRPMLLDFGIAARDAESTLALRDKVVGTPAFLAPEMLLPGAQATPATDVYGLGATLYCLLTLRAPYEGSLTSVLSQVQRLDPTPAGRLRPLPRDLAAILDKALDREPRRRYATATELASDLQAFLEHRPVVARPVTTLHRLTRRIARSREGRAVAALLLVAALGAGGWWWHEARTTARAQDFLTTWAPLPPVLQLAGAIEQRPLGDIAQRQRIGSMLDRAVALAADPTAPLLLRAAYRLDHGNPAGAAADMQALAQLHPTPYLQSLAAWYRDGAPSLNNPVPTTPLPLGPAPTTTERHVAAFHEMRAPRTPERTRAALALLEGATTPLPLAATELLLLLRMVQATNLPSGAAEKLPLLRQLFELAVQSEQRLGVATATTLYAAATALAGQGRHAEALPRFEAALQLTPDHFHLRMNLGVSLHKLGRTTEAIVAMQQSLQIRQDVLGAHENLVGAHLDLEQWDAARAAITAMPAVTPEAGQRLRSQWSARLELTRAVRLLARGDKAGAQDAATEAADHFEAAELRPSTSFDAALAAAIASDEASSTAALLEWMCDQPDAWRRLADVAELLPETLDAAHTATLRTYLRALVHHFAPVEVPKATPNQNSNSSPTAPKPTIR